MSLRALPAHAVDISRRARRHDFLDLAEAQSGAQPSGEAHRLLCFAFGQFSDGRKCGMHHVDGEANRMRKFRIQQQKFRHPQWPKLRRVSLAIGLKGRAGLQQSDPLQIFFALDGLIERLRAGCAK